MFPQEVLSNPCKQRKYASKECYNSHVLKLVCYFVLKYNQALCIWSAFTWWKTVVKERGRAKTTALKSVFKVWNKLRPKCECWRPCYLWEWLLLILRHYFIALNNVILAFKISFVCLILSVICKEKSLVSLTVSETVCQHRRPLVLC